MFKVRKRHVALLLVLVVPALMGSESSCTQKKSKPKPHPTASTPHKPKTTQPPKKYAYRYDCNFEDFYGGVEMQGWEGSGTHRPAASPDPFGALSIDAGVQPQGISLHVRARALTPVVPLPRGARPRLECKIIRHESPFGSEKTIAGPQHLSSRRTWLQLDARAS